MNLYTGIIGGCMMCQPGLQLSELYFRRFSHLVEEHFGIMPRVSFGYYNDFYKVPLLADHLFKKEAIKLVVFQIRPAPILARSEFMISDYQGGLILNPLLKKRKNYQKLEEILGQMNPVIRGPNGFSWWKRCYLIPLHKHRVRLGELSGLVKNTQAYLQQTLLMLQKKCAENDAALFVVSPVPTSNKNRNDLLFEMNVFLKDTIADASIPYIDVFSAFLQKLDAYLTEDRIHLNAAGHDLLANKLFDEFCKYKEYHF